MLLVLRICMLAGWLAVVVAEAGGAPHLQVRAFGSAVLLLLLLRMLAGWLLLPRLAGSGAALCMRAAVAVFAARLGSPLICLCTHAAAQCQPSPPSRQLLSNTKALGSPAAACRRWPSRRATCLKTRAAAWWCRCGSAGDGVQRPALACGWCGVRAVEWWDAASWHVRAGSCSVCRPLPPAIHRCLGGRGWPTRG